MSAPHRLPLSRRHVLAATVAAAAVMSAGAPAGAASNPEPASDAAGRSPVVGRPRLAPLPLSAVRLLDSPFRDNMRRTCSYLLFVDPDRLLHTFRTNVGLASDAVPCGGWEAPDVLLRGHTTGHLLSALAQAHAQTGDDAYAAKARTVVSALAACQNAATTAGYRPGYLSAFPEAVFDDLEAGGRPWSPYYTLHKIMAGLLDQYTLSGNQQAMSVLTSMAAWVDSRTAPLPHEQMQALLKVEFGGMNDVLTNLYLVSGDPAHLRTARRFDHEDLYAPLAAGRDELSGRHANTEIAKVVGAPHSYEATGERRYLDIARYFWQTVVDHHSYAIGGNSNLEFFGPPDEIASRLSENTCENCNSYNMLKLGRQLFLHDPSHTGYMDHYEWTLHNQMLGEQDPDSEHGFVTYYTGLWAGSRRQVKDGLGAAPGSYSSDYDNFSCDHGTGLETHTKFADTIWFQSDDALWVNLFIPSEVTWARHGVTLRQRAADGDTVRIAVTAGSGRFALKVRIPGWLAKGRGRAHLRVAGRDLRGRIEPGSYVTVDRHWRTGDTVELTLPREPVWQPAPDNPQVRSLSYGPLVLAGTFGGTELAAIPSIRPDSLKQVPGSAVEFTAATDGWTGAGTGGGVVTLKPFHQVQHENYSVYWAVGPRPARERDVVHYPLGEGTGALAADATRTFGPALLSGSASWTASGPGGRPAVQLDGTGGHVAMAPGLPAALAELTVSVWVRVDVLANSSRVFDLGYHKDTYLFLTTRTGSGRARAALKIAGMEAEDVIDAAGPMPVGTWTHVALTLGGGTGILYVAGAEAGRNTSMVAGPLLLGATTHNYLGRSQNPTHPYLTGAVADFRLHNRVLTAAEAAALAGV